MIHNSPTKINSRGSFMLPQVWDRSSSLYFVVIMNHFVRNCRGTPPMIFFSLYSVRNQDNYDYMGKY